MCPPVGRVVRIIVSWTVSQSCVCILCGACLLHFWYFPPSLTCISAANSLTFLPRMHVLEAWTTITHNFWCTPRSIVLCVAVSANGKVRQKFSYILHYYPFFYDFYLTRRLKLHGVIFLVWHSPYSWCCTLELSLDHCTLADSQNVSQSDNSYILFFIDL